MRRIVILGALGIVGLVGGLWLVGALDGLGVWLAEAQRAAQDRLAGAIRSLRAGEAGALAAFWALCFGYGVLHAAGPGHGKLVIGGYGLARQVPVGRLAGLALASSLAQAAVAVALVYALVAILGLARGAVEGAAEDWLTPAGHVMIAGLGLWLVWRGIAGLRRSAAGPQAGGAGDGHSHSHSHSHSHNHDHHQDPAHHAGHGHHHDHHHDQAHCAVCGHAHGPTLAEVERVASLREALALVAGIALRPCSGALFVLILTWQLGIGMAGVIGAVVMALGTALVTVGVAALSVWAREGAVSILPGGRLARALPLVELALGGIIAIAAVGLLLQGR
jgi:ABC-type nickel/cobalt efflux system permease component RcnA